MTLAMPTGAMETGPTSAILASIETNRRGPCLVLQGLKRQKGSGRQKLFKARSVVVPLDQISAFIRLVDNAIGMARRLDLLPKAAPAPRRKASAKKEDPR